MDDHIRLIISAQNTSSPAFQAATKHVNAMQQALRQAGPAAAQTGKAMQSAMQAASQHVSQANRAVRSFAPAVQSMGALAGRALSGLLGVFKSLGSAVLGLARQIVGTLAGAFRTLATAATVAGAVVAGALTAAFVATAKAGIDMNSTIDRATAALTRMTGSGAAASSFVAALRKEAETSAPTLKELLPIAQSLAAAYGPANLGRVLPTIRAFGDAAISLGANTDQMKNSLLGFRQLLGRDFAQQEELNQISENLPGLDVKGILKSNFGTADTEALKAAEVSGQQVGAALIAGMQAAFGGAQAGGALKLGVLFSNITDTFDRLSGKITEGLLGSLEGGGGAVTKFLASFQALVDNDSIVKALAVPFDLVGKAISAAADQLPAFVAWLEKILTKENIINVLSSVAAWVQTIGDEVGRFIGIATGGQGLTGIWEAFGKAATAALDLVVRAWNGFVAGVEYLVQNSDQIWGLMADGIKLVGKGIDALIGGVVLLGAAIVSSKIIDLVTGIAGAAGAIGNIGGALGFGGKAGAGGIMKGLPGAAGFIGGPAGMGLAAGGLALNTAIHGGFGPGVQKAFVGSGGVSRAGGLGRAMDPFGYLSPQASAAAQPAGGVDLSGHAAWGLDKLSQLGGATRGVVGGALGQFAGNIPDRIRSLFGGLQGAMQRGAGTGLDSLLGKVDQHRGANASALNSFLASPTGAAAIAPPHQMGGGGGGAAAGLNIISEKDAKKIREARDSFFDAMMAQAELLASEAAEGWEARGEANELIRVLDMKQQDLLNQAQSILPQIAKNAEKAKEYYDLKRQAMDIEARVNGLQDQAAKEEKTELEKAARETLDVANSRVKLAEARLKNTVGLSDEQRKRMLIPALMEQFRATSAAQPGETESQQLDRMTEMEGIRGQIHDALGANRGSAQLLGGGSIPLYDEGAIRSVDQQLSGIAQAGAQVVFAPAATIMGDVDLSPDSRATRNLEEMFYRWLAHLQQQAQPAWAGN